MHFHEQAQCPECYRRREASTPIADILWLATLCEWCGSVGYIGLDDGHSCRTCRMAWLADRDQQRQYVSFMHGEAQGELPRDA